MRSSSSVLLIGLAVADTLTLWINLPEHWIIDGLGYNYEKHLILCKLADFIIVPISYFSVYAIVILTIFRLISVYVPHKAKIFCTRKRAYFSLIFTYVIFQLSQVHNIIIKRVEIEDGYSDCTWGEHEDFFQKYYYFIVLVFITIIPFIIIIGGNIMIIIKISKRKAPKNEIKKQRGRNYINNEGASSSPIDKQKTKITSQKSGSMNSVLITVSILFVLSNMPFYVSNIIFH